MFHRAKVLIIALAVLLAFTACRPSGPATISLSERDAGREIELHKGDLLEISLEGNPGTGYSWEALTGESPVLEQMGETEFIQEKKLAGSPGQFVLRFEAISAGEQALQLVYHRSWETDVLPLNTFEVSVMVEE